MQQHIASASASVVNELDMLLLSAIYEKYSEKIPITVAFGNY